MDLHAIRTLYDQHMRQQDSDPRTEREATPHVLRFVLPDEQIGFILYSRLTEVNADQVIAAQVAHFREKGLSFEWKYFDYDMSADLPQRLLKHGFSADDPEAILVLPIADAPEKLLAPPGHEVRIVTDEAGFADADSVHAEVWPGLPPPSQRVRGMLSRDPQSVSLHVAYMDGKPVSYGRVEFQPGSPFASLWGGATLEAARGRGAYTALVASRLQEAKQRGCDYLTVDADPTTSMPILHKLGFQTIAMSTPYMLQG